MELTTGILKVYAKVRDEAFRGANLRLPHDTIQIRFDSEGNGVIFDDTMESAMIPI